MRTVKAVISSSVLVMLMVASPAIAKSHHQPLRGDFAVSSSTNCIDINPPNNFLANLGVPPGVSTNISSSSLLGVWTFNGDGTGNWSARKVMVGGGGGSAIAVENAAFTYSVAADGLQFTVQLVPSISRAVAGPAIGGLATITDIPPLVGFLSADRNSMVFGTYDPGVETAWRFTDNDSSKDPVVITYRICHRTETGVRISQ